MAGAAQARLKGAAMLYDLYEFNQAALAPVRAVAAYWEMVFASPLNPFSQTQAAKSAVAGLNVFRRVTSRFAKPAFGLNETLIDGQIISVKEEEVWHRDFCTLLRFRRESTDESIAAQSKLLIVAPLSGHHATLLRGTVQAMLPYHDVYITDWIDAREVPPAQSTFGLDDYIDYIIDILRDMGPDVHVIGVCQPSVPVLAAAALMAEDKDPNRPKSMTLMGGPIDSRINPTAVNLFAQKHSLEWFKETLISRVPFPYPGVMRRVYPGFVQLSGFLGMNFDRHVEAHWDYFRNLVRGDGDSIETHKRFYDEYLAVMDMTEEFYLETVRDVFQLHLLPRGLFKHRGRIVRPQAITDIALLTVEGERDDISGVGQTKAAHDLCTHLDPGFRDHYLAPDVGHYGVFNGTRWRTKIAPKVRDFIALHSQKAVRTDNVIPLKN